MKPNLVERLEELAYALECAQQHMGDDDQHSSDAYTDVNNAYGIVGEIMRMVDGR